ncbi:hypothetical protein B484DRAFT_455920 [Ochromonadaceae sp. CCMP2298]|nr:hypothetical protein B484DRAFT_455920 [Ochromonadaceae sp. CCMP2298]
MGLPVQVQRARVAANQTSALPHPFSCPILRFPNSTLSPLSTPDPRSTHTQISTHMHTSNNPYPPSPTLRSTSA